MGSRSAKVWGTLVLAAFVTLVAVPGAGAALAAVTASATPATNLLDGETILVSGAAFDPNAQVGVAECLSGATGPAQCDLTGVSFTTTDSLGAFSIQFNVTRFINVGGAITDCAGPDNCVIGIEQTANPSLSITVGILFEDLPVPLPTVQVLPSTNLFDRQPVHVAGTGFTPRASVALVECEGNSTAISQCDPFTILISQADVNGNVDSVYLVTRVININGSSFDCAVPPGCTLGVGNVDDYLQRSIVPLSFVNAPAQNPSITVVPSTNLSDGQTVTVTGTGFSANAIVNVTECRSGSTGPSDCLLESVQSISADVAGSFSATYKVIRNIQIESTTVDCALSGACELAVMNADGLSPAIVVPLAFAQAQVVGSPVTPAGLLAMTGSSSGLLVRIGTGLAVVGLTLLVLSRVGGQGGVRRRAADGTSARR